VQEQNEQSVNLKAARAAEKGSPVARSRAGACLRYTDNPNPVPQHHTSTTAAAAVARVSRGTRKKCITRPRMGRTITASFLPQRVRASPVPSIPSSSFINPLGSVAEAELANARGISFFLSFLLTCLLACLLACLLTYSIDRMPTVSAAQALEELQSSSATRWISTGLARLDAALLRGGERGAVSATSGFGDGGVVRGQVTEIYGPPGVGKTALG
jgi:hypothetical protein